MKSIKIRYLIEKTSTDAVKVKVPLLLELSPLQVSNFLEVTIVAQLLDKLKKCITDEVVKICTNERWKM